jgi:photosystem II stability/assembly factor-like uncharacterized protein
MTGELVLSVLQRSGGACGYVAGFAVTDQRIVALGGTSDRSPIVIVSSDARHFEPRSTPRGLGLRDALAVGDSLWVCGEYGQLAVSRDHGGRWQLLETATEVCLFALALGSDGAIWVVGEAGYAARVLGEEVRRVDVGTTARLASVHAVRDELVMLGSDGIVRRWRDGEVIEAACGTTRALTGLAVTSKGTWIVIGDGGFVARSPDGAWYSRVPLGSGADVDLEAIGVLSDGTIAVVGDRGRVLISTDDARTWRGIEHQLGTAHLWSIERFGRGLLIGGDDGLIARLAPRDDATWSERSASATPASLDEVFAAGPDGFIATRLATYLAALAGHAAPGDASDREDSEAADADALDREAFTRLGRPGTAEDFRVIYGVTLPTEAAQFFARVAGHDRWTSFAELRLDHALRPDVGDHNLFELMVRRNQRAYLGTDLIEAFSGVFGIGSQGNGDSYHLEVHAWEGRRQVLHFDHETAVFSGVIADSLDSLVYLAALVNVGDDHAISRAAYAAGLHALRGKVAPTWHFAIDEKDDAFVAHVSERHETEFFFHRARWLCALLKHDGVTELEDIATLFDPELNPVIAADQLAARFEACAQVIPTALYAMWRAYLFDEPELARYLEIGRQHAARLVRDAARLIDELRGGRNELGTIADVRAWIAGFRALDLDPRRADQRRVEAEARARADAARLVEHDAELARTPVAAWTDLAWRTISDGVAHRALLARLDHTQGAQLAELDELRDLDDDLRPAAVLRIAEELSPELEAVLVGSLVRDDQLDGVLFAPADDDGDDKPPGWTAIDRALAPVYGGVEPLHYGTVLPYGLGGNDPISGISAYARQEPAPHWHFVTYGFTDLFRKESEDPEESGFGFELTFRLVRDAAEAQPPTWALNFLQNLGRYVFGTGNAFAAGHKMGLNGPIALDHATQITAICFAPDPELGEISSRFGKATFVQIVGITDDEYRLIQEWSTTGLIEILAQRLPLLVTDLARSSVLDDPATASVVRARVAAEGSSEDLTFAGELRLDAADDALRIELGALYAATLPRAMRGRLLHGRGYELSGRATTLRIEPAQTAGFHRDGDDLVLEVTAELAHEIEAALRDALVGTYRFTACPSLTIVVVPSLIRGQDGSATEVRGVADPDEVRRIIAADAARLAAEADGAAGDDAEGAGEADDEAEGDGEDQAEAEAAGDRDDEGEAEVVDGQDDDDDYEGETNDVPDPVRVAAALAMTARGLQLAPHDPDLQFTHAMLLLDAERAGDPARGSELIALLSKLESSVRINVAVRMAKARHVRFAEAVDRVLAEPLPAHIFEAGSSTIDGGAHIVSFGDVAHELLTELGDAILAHTPGQLGKLARLLPDDAILLSELAAKALDASQREAAVALYDRVVALAVPDDGSDRTNYLRALNNACVQAHAAGAFDAAARIADRAQPVAAENPHIFHAAACAYAAAGDPAKAVEQVKLAIEHDYEHIAKIETDHDLGALLERPELQALFRDWHARREGN